VYFFVIYQNKNILYKIHLFYKVYFYMIDFKPMIWYYIFLIFMFLTWISFKLFIDYNKKKKEEKKKN
jgi:hypothetical protein